MSQFAANSRNIDWARQLDGAGACVITNEPVKHRRAVADGLLLYHVLHPTDSDRDEWTQHYARALAYFKQVVREYGHAHLHAEIHHTAQYDAECLLRTETDEIEL